MAFDLESDALTLNDANGSGALNDFSASTMDSMSLENFLEIRIDFCKSIVFLNSWIYFPAQSERCEANAMRVCFVLNSHSIFFSISYLDMT